MKPANLRKLSSLRCPLSPPIYQISLTSSPFSSSSSSSSPSPSSQSSDSSPFMVDYFIRSFGCSKEKAIHASKRLLHLNSSEKPDSVLAFLRRLGLSESQLCAAVLRRPSILTSDVKSNLLPKIKFFESLGASGKELAGLVASSTACLGNSIDRRLLPCVDFLRSILHDDKKIRYALKRCPFILTNDPDKMLSRNIRFLREKGLDSSLISSLVYKSPNVLIMTFEQLNLAYKTVEQLGLSSTPAVRANALHVVTSVSKETLSRKLEILRSFGLEESHISVLCRWYPSVFRLNGENLKRKMNFFLNKMGYDLEKLLKSPLQMGLSLEERLMPRYGWIQNMQSKGLVSKEVNFARAFLMSEEKFVDEFVYRFKDEYGLDVLEAYKECTGRAKESPLEDSDLKEVI